MKGDFSRDTFRKEKHYSGVLMQQGRVLLDADWNEQQAINNHRRDTEALDVIGRAGAPAEGGGLCLLPVPTNDDLLISPGRIYVDGIMAELEEGSAFEVTLQGSDYNLKPVPWTVDGRPFVAGMWLKISVSSLDQLVRVSSVDQAQKTIVVTPPLKGISQPSIAIQGRRLASIRHHPDIFKPSGDLLGDIELLGSGSGPVLIYVDMWKRHVTAKDDPHIRELALGGPDTATREKVVVQVRAKSLPSLMPSINASSAAISRLIALQAETAGYARPTSEQKTAIRLEKERIFDSARQLYCDHANVPDLSSSGRMKALAASPSESSGPCPVATGGGYQARENQLYRVEVHKGGLLGEATFKWSRDNGSRSFQISRIEGNRVELSVQRWDPSSIPRSESWVELIDDGLELSGSTGLLRQVERADPVEPVIYLLGDLSGMQVGTSDDLLRHPILRAWDHATVASAPATEDGIKTSSSWLPLCSDGIMVQFSPGTYRTGDYWQIPAREATRGIEWASSDSSDENPSALPPFGVRHHLAPLAIAFLQKGAAGSKICLLHDCRTVFSGASKDITLDRISGDGQEAMPNALLPGSLCIRLRRGGVALAGARVIFSIEQGAGWLLPGERVDSETISSSKSRILTMITDLDGTARARWIIDKTVFQKVKVIAPDVFLLDQNGSQLFAGSRHYPNPTAFFNAFASIAENVSYQPSEGFTGLSKATTVRDALELLARTYQARGCADTVGEGGRYPSLIAALNEQFSLQNDVSLCLLPGEHALPSGFRLNRDGAVLRISGCGPSSIIRLGGPIGLKGLAMASFKDLSIRGGEIKDDMVAFENCSDASVESCDVTGVSSFIPQEVRPGSAHESLIVSYSDLDGVVLGNKFRSLALAKGSAVPLTERISLQVANSQSLRYMPVVITSSPPFYGIRSQSAGGDFAWDHRNFSGFFYDLDDDLGCERLEIRVTEGITLKGDQPFGLVYTTKVAMRRFSFDRAGVYRMVPICGEPYFAGYALGEGEEKSLLYKSSTDPQSLEKGQVQKLLLDDRSTRTLKLGDAVQLSGGYSIKVSDFEQDRKVYLSILKNNESKGTLWALNPAISGTTISDHTCIFKADCGAQRSLALIAVHISGIASLGRDATGRVSFQATVDWIWQISDQAVKLDGMQGTLRTASIDAAGGVLTFDNKDKSITLSPNRMVPVISCGDSSIFIASGMGPRTSFWLEKRIGNSSGDSASYTIRGTVATSDASWTPQTFPAFFRDPVSDEGAERLEVRITGDRKAFIDSPSGALYKCTAKRVPFALVGWGSYMQLCFNGRPHLASYLPPKEGASAEEMSLWDNEKNQPLANGQIYEVLIDDASDKPISSDRPIALAENLAVKIATPDLEKDRLTVVLFGRAGQVISTCDLVISDMGKSLKADTALFRTDGTRGGIVTVAVRVRKRSLGIRPNMITWSVQGIWQVSGKPVEVKAPVINESARSALFRLKEVGSAVIRDSNLTTSTYGTAIMIADGVGDIAIENSKISGSLSLYGHQGIFEWTPEVVANLREMIVSKSIVMQDGSGILRIRGSRLEKMVLGSFVTERIIGYVSSGQIELSDIFRIISLQENSITSGVELMALFVQLTSNKLITGLSINNCAAYTGNIGKGTGTELINGSTGGPSGKAANVLLDITDV